MKVISYKKRIKYFIEAFFIYLFYFIFRSLPIESSSKLGATILGFISRFIKENNTAAQNMKMCLPHLTKNQRNKILLNTWKHFGSVIGEIPHWHKMSKNEFFERVTIRDKKTIPFSRAIIVSGHIGNWELISRIAKEYGIKLNLVYRPSNNPYANYLINKIRESYKITLIPKGSMGVKKIIKALNNKEIVGIMVDQKMDDGISIPFFDKHAMTTALPANIALKYKIPIIATSIIKTGTSRYTASFHEPLKIREDDTKYTISKRINLILEGWIKDNPEQWFWFHNRWK
jgi:KDO2-lipid IV(A) lauroyltransferase